MKVNWGYLGIIAVLLGIILFLIINPLKEESSTQDQSTNQELNKQFPWCNTENKNLNFNVIHPGYPNVVFKYYTEGVEYIDLLKEDNCILKVDVIKNGEKLQDSRGFISKDEYYTKFYITIYYSQVGTSFTDTFTGGKCEIDDSVLCKYKEN